MNQNKIILENIKRKKLELLQSNDYSTMTNKEAVKLNNEMKKLDIIKNHPHRIWQTASGSFKTYVYDESKSKNRRLIERKNLENLENLIIDEFEKNNSITFHYLYAEWISTYKRNEISATTLARYHSDYKKYYENSKLDNMNIKDINKLDCEIFLTQHINKYEFNRKQLNNMKLILKQVLEYAIDKNIIEKSPLDNVHIKKNRLTPIIKGSSDTQVFNKKECEAVFNYIKNDFENCKDTAPLGVLLSFQLGLRVGELVALKVSDFYDGIVHVERTEISYIPYNENMEKLPTIHKIIGRTKTPAGVRDIILTDKATTILNLIISINKENGFTSEYLFLNDKGERMNRQRINTYLYSVCNALNQTRKSSHKIRKTVISSLIDGGMNFDDIRVLCGHAEIRTTLNSYCYSRDSSESKKILMDKLL